MSRLLVRVVERSYRPEVAAYERRRHLLTRRETHWVAPADDDMIWTKVPASLLRRLNLVTTRRQLDQLLRGVR